MIVPDTNDTNEKEVALDNEDPSYTEDEKLRKPKGKKIKKFKRGHDERAY